MNLLDNRFDKYSKCGNDGIIEAILKTAGIEKGTFVEFGAWDGIMGSNCRKLFEEGWEGVFVEPEVGRYNDLRRNYDSYTNITCIQSMIGHKTDLFDDVVGLYVDKIDFCSIDIDGLDLDVFETFTRHLPTVICMEGGQMLEPNHKRIPQELSRYNVQQSLSVIDESCRKKGYRILCSYQDTFMIKEELFHKFDVSENMMDLYLDGIKVLARRIPWILQTLNKVGLKNDLLLSVLNECNYDKYGWSGRKRWAVSEKEVIDDFIEKVRDGYKS